MAIETIFKYSEAAQWQATVTELNEDTDSVLEAIAKCIQSISEGCTGSAVETLVAVGENMLQKFKELISAVMDLISALADVLNKFKEFEQGFVDGLKEMGENILGGLGIG